MRKSGLAALAVAAIMGALAAPGAQAGVVTFEDVGFGTMVFEGESFSSGGFTFTQGSNTGLVADTSTFSIFGNAPTGNATQFYGGFNDGAVTMTLPGGAFRLAGLDFGFISPVGGFDAEADSRRLVVSGHGVDGSLYTLLASWGDADANGEFSFQTLAGDALSTWGFVDSVTFFGCKLTAGGDCVGMIDNQNQFALDNITAVPEPGSLALAALALGVAGSLRRRPSR